MSPVWSKFSLVSKLTPNEELLNTQQVHERTGWSITSINRWALKGILPAHKLPGKTGAYLFRAEDVDAHLASRRAAA